MATPISIEAYKKYGVHRSIVSFACNNHFQIPKYLQDCFRTYQLIVMPAEKFLARFSAGQMHEDQVHYDVIFKQCSRGRLKKLLETNPNLTVLCSLRIPQPEFDLPPTAIVQIDLKSITSQNLEG